jgi:hypothetical protein
MAEKSRKRAEQCRMNAENGYDEAAWLDLADDWTKLAEALEQEDARVEELGPPKLAATAVSDQGGTAR